MRKTPVSTSRWAAFGCAFAVGILVLVGAAPAQQPAGQQKRLETLRAKGAKASITVFPVAMLETHTQNVADALGMLLETKAGMEKIERTAIIFAPPAAANAGETPELFGEFIRKNPIMTDYALYAEFVGGPKAGVEEVRTIVVDEKGRPVWVDRQTPEDSDFRRIRVRNPMTCCLLVTERLRAALKLKAPRGKPSGEGRMAKLWAAKSDAPDDRERAAIKTRLATLKSAGKAADVVVFAAQVGGESDEPAARHLAKLLNERGLCQARVAKQKPHFDITPSSNQQKRLWDLARGFREHVRAKRIDADYALYPQYLILPDQKVWAVHFIVCDKSGEWVIVDFQNDHHGDFNQVDPKSRDDCGRLVAKRLEGYFR